MFEMLLRILLSLFSTLFLFTGFAYLVWAFASKESGKMATVGKVVAYCLAAFALLSFVYGAYNGIQGAMRYSARSNPAMSRQRQAMPAPVKSQKGTMKLAPAKSK